jgi:hypothetical protein
VRVRPFSHRQRPHYPALSVFRSLSGSYRFFSQACSRTCYFSSFYGKIRATWSGLLHANIIKTGDHSYCIIAEWEDMNACIQARRI